MSSVIVALEKLKKEKESQFMEIKYLEKKVDENKSIKVIENDEDLDIDLAIHSSRSLFCWL